MTESITLPLPRDAKSSTHIWNNFNQIIDCYYPNHFQTTNKIFFSILIHNCNKMLNPLYPLSLSVLINGSQEDINM